MKARIDPRRARGQSMTEFLIVFPALIMLVFGIIQFALIYQARVTLNHAAMLVARAGALHNGNRSEMQWALATGLTPLFAKEPDLANYTIERTKLRFGEVIAPNITRIQVLNPTRAALNDFGRPRLDGTAGRELPSDTLNYRSTTPGATSQISVQDANIIHVRVSYCFRLVVPVMDRVIHASVNALTPFAAAVSANGMSDPFGTNGTTVTVACQNPLFRGPRITITSEAMVRMQSPFYESNL